MSERNEQTRFSLEEPLFEQMGQLPPDLEHEETKHVERPPWYKRKKLVIAIITAVTVLFLLILFIITQFILQGRLPTILDLDEITTTSVDRTGHPLMQRIIAAERELVAADPTKRELSYPTLDYAIELDPAGR